MTKRIFDITGSLLGLLIIGPILLVIVCWIKLDSPGPVFFRQVRVGQFGHHFRIFKFRTMVINADKIGERITIGNDQRITRCGHFLRKYKIDELPQLIDVLRGKMSLVGPRPEVPEFVEHYEPAIRQKILSVKPGITDRASIEMIDENEILAKFDDPKKGYIEEIMPIKARYYIDYAENHSTKGDIKIILETVIRLIR